MALDILSAPSSSVDVERAFPGGRLALNYRQHRTSVATFRAEGATKPESLDRSAWIVWVDTFYEDVDPDNDDDGLTEQRLEQWRPLWQNPFANPDIGLSSSGSDYSQFLAANAGDNVEKAS
ncbi:hAT family dimerization protein [Rhizoctonia solani]|uniref:HAT family dimerization protein n=1 Tax=Rhizoctonia solani TaxID=456999 RepID=A0A8H8NXK2_9AGAM|nr:hAT family dimerization protein [Rhizoctonia solani]QRW20602.1 hAT family dimerization protein [Rhizoctonia solani]